MYGSTCVDDVPILEPMLPWDKFGPSPRAELLLVPAPKPEPLTTPRPPPMGPAGPAPTCEPGAVGLGGFGACLCFISTLALLIMVTMASDNS